MKVILNQIEKLRAEPEHKRRRWTVGLSAGITMVIVMIWAANLSLTFSVGSLANQVPKPSPFSQMAGSAAVNFTEFKTGLSDAMTGFISMFND